MTSLDDLLPPLAATADRPLAGTTLLLVEDSRLACEAMRLLCLRSGARLRRADTLEAAERHLRAWRPGAVVVDLHLPDGSGLDLLAALSRQRPRLDALLATSGDPALERAARLAGADGFLAKPATLAAFQSALLACLPPQRRPMGPRPVPHDAALPDPIALRDDLSHAQALLAAPRVSLDYVARFLAGVARSAGDPTLLAAAQSAAATGVTAPLAAALRARLERQPAL